jgi:membrane protein
MRDQLLRIGKRFVAELGRDDEAGLAAELAYRFLFAIFPFGIFVAALTAFIANAIGFADPTGRIMGAVGDNLPPDVAAAIRPQLETVLGQTRPGLLTIGALAALWAATGGMQALMKALNRAWEVEETRGLIPKYALSIGLTLLGSVGLIGAFVTIVGASLLTEEVIAQLGLDRTAIDLAALLRWPLVFVLLSAAVGILYRLAPNFRAPWRWCFAGGALFSVVWILATWLFSLYLANFANYANTYGALGGVIALMLWFYLSAFILCAAAALIAAALKELQPTRVAAARVQAGSPAVPTGDRDRSGHATPNPAGTPSSSPIPPRAVAPPERRARPALPGRRRPVPAYRMSGPEDWALAGVVTVVGASIGAGLALALGASRR